MTARDSPWPCIDNDKTVPTRRSRCGPAGPHRLRLVGTVLSLSIQGQGVSRAVILSAVRTPVGRYGGDLSGVRPDDLAAVAVAAAVQRSGVDPARIEDVYFGCANQAGEDNRNVARM